jgi:Fe(3+) dicitrate transport protein
MRQRFSYAILMVLFVLASGAGVWGQSAEVALEGWVGDSQGGALSSSQISLQRLEAGATEKLKITLNAAELAAPATFFAGAHRGFAPPRTEDIAVKAGGSVDLDPELSWNYEIGFRAAPRSGLQLEATLFRLGYANQIIPASLAGGAGATLTNGGGTLHQGLEASGRVDLGALVKSPHNLYLRTSYTYLPEAEFRGARFSNIAGFSAVSVSGNRLPYAPEHLLNAALGYSGASGVDALIEANYISRQFADDLNAINPTADGQRGLIPSNIVWNATFNYRVEKMRSTFFVTAENLFDRLYIADRARHSARAAAFAASRS